MLHYHRRNCFSLLCSEWLQVVQQRYRYQAYPFKKSNKLINLIKYSSYNLLGVVWLRLSGN